MDAKRLEEWGFDGRSLHDALRLRVARALEERGYSGFVARLREALVPNTELHVVGGFVRDCLRSLVEEPTTAKDLDIVVRTAHLEASLRAIPGSVQRTSLGGYRWQGPGPRENSWIDVWQLQDTLWIRRLGLPVSLDSLLSGIDLNVDRILFGLHDASIEDRGCLAGIQAREIDLDAEVRVPEYGPFELARAILAHLRTGYALAERVLERVDARSEEVLGAPVRARLEGDGYSERALRGLRGFVAERRKLHRARNRLSNPA